MTLLAVTKISKFLQNYLSEVRKNHIVSDLLNASHMLKI